MHIFHFMFFANDLLFTLYFIFQTREMMLDKKQTQVILLFEFKMSVKAAETIHNSTMHLAQELLMNVQHSGGSRSFAKKTRALKIKSAVAGHWKLTTTNWEQSLKQILLQLHKKWLKNSASTSL